MAVASDLISLLALGGSVYPIRATAEYLLLPCVKAFGDFGKPACFADFNRVFKRMLTEITHVHFVLYSGCF